LGAGSGYLKELMPTTHKDDLISSDYNPRNLQAGMERRTLTAIGASAYELPIRDASVEAVVDLDAFDTLPNFDKAFKEVERVLKPGGKFVHFQINCPSDDMLDHDFPSKVWLPQATPDDFMKRAAGVERDELVAALDGATMPGPWDKVMRSIIADPMYRHAIEGERSASDIIKIVDEITTELGVGRVLVPSIFDYFNNKLASSAAKAGLTIVESGFKQESALSPDGRSTDLVLGHTKPRQSSRMVSGGQAWRAASMMVFVAQKNIE
jgi:ubiquinone/menaquinone biosynthesis C-methylase UbiE